MNFKTFIATLFVLLKSSAANDQVPLQVQNSLLITKHGSDSDSTPLLLWHGFGDYYNSPSMTKVIDQVHEVHPDKYIYSIHVADSDVDDQRGSIVANMNEVIPEICELLSEDEILQNAPKIDVMGFSQGGLFARTLIQNCTAMSGKFNHLITFGSPHNGIGQFPSCETQKDKISKALCEKKNELLKKKVYDPDFQNSFTFAQFFRNSSEYDQYLQHNIYLVFYNNELEINRAYKENLSKLQGKFVMHMFTDDTVVQPKESAWFYDTTFDNKVLPLRYTLQFRFDLIGLATLLYKNKLVFETIEGEHMSISNELLQSIAEKYL